MTITSTGLTRGAAVAAVTSGLIFIGVQINHPPMVTASVDTTEWVIRNTLKVVMAALALAGITGMYLRQIKQAGARPAGLLVAQRRLPPHHRYRVRRRLRPAVACPD
jgi:hypothetical protein